MEEKDETTVEKDEEEREEEKEEEKRTESRLVHLHWADAKVYHIVPLEQRKLCTTLRINLSFFFKKGLFKETNHLYTVSIVLKSYIRYSIINYLRNVVTSII